MTDQIKPPAVETTEIASVTRDPFLPLFSGLLQQNDDTLATRGQGKGIRLYEEIERDAQVFACLHKRKMAVISRPWEVKPASNSALDQQAAELVEAQLDAIGFDHLCMNLLDAINKGFAVGEILWQANGSQIVAAEVRARDQRRFWFGENYELRLKTLSNLLPGDEMPERKFIVHSLGAKDSNPYGMGLGSKLFWLVWFKRQGITFWLTLLDKFGSPTSVGKYPTGTNSADQQKLLDALSAISQDAGVIVPEGMVIELLEATRGGQAGYEQMIRYMDEQISYCILGESPSARGSGGALASAAITRNEVRLELVQYDSDMLSATLNNTLVKWISEYNVPGATAPTVWRKISEAEDIKIRAERDLILVEMGGYPDAEYQVENYPGWTFTKPATTPSVKTPGNDAAFAEADVFADQAALDGSIEGISATQMNMQARAALKPVLDLIAQSADYAEVFDKLAETYPAMDTKQLEQTLARAMFVADVWGKLSVDNA